MDTRKYLCVAVALILISLASTLPGAHTPFVTTGEPREAVVAQSMIIEGDLLQSVRYGSDIATKPPLLHWAMVLVASLTGGLDETAARLPSILAATFVLVSWTLFTIPLLGLTRSLLSFAILLTTVEWFRNAAHARVDMLLAAMVSIALLCLFQWSQSKQVKLLLGATLAMALAALTKGPVGVALPILTAGIALLVWRQCTLRRGLQLAYAALAALLPLLAWYAAEFYVTNGALLDIVLHENLDRLRGTMSVEQDPHTHGPIYLLGTFLGGLMPWSLFASFPLLMRLKNRSWTIDMENTDARRFIQWCLITVGVCLAVFCIPSSKRSVYLLPAFPAASTLVALEIHRFFAGKKNVTRRILIGASAFLSIVWLGVILFARGRFDLNALSMKPKHIERATFYRDVLANDGLLNSFWMLAPIFVAIAIVYLFRSRWEANFMRLSLLITFFTVVVKLTIILPAAVALSPRAFITTELKDHHPSEISLRTIRMYAEAFYIRQIRPGIPLKDFSRASTFVLQLDDSKAYLPAPLYIHQSEGSVFKPGRHLQFAILGTWPEGVEFPPDADEQPEEQSG